MLKHVVALFAVLAVASSASAQDFAIDQGSLVLDGTISYSSDGGDLYENADGDRVSTALLNPSVLYFVVPGLAIGGELYVESASQGDFSLTTIGVGPEVTYFFGGPESTVFPYVGVNLAYASLSSDAFDASGIGFGFGAGAAFMLSNSVAITAGGSYEITNLSIDQVDDTQSGNTFRLELGIAAFLF